MGESNAGYTIVIVILSVIASFSMTGLFLLIRRLNVQEDQIEELEDRITTIHREFLAHTHTESKTEPTIPAMYPIMRYTVEKRKRTRW